MSYGPPHLAPRTQSLTGVRIVGTGCALPERVVTNEDLRESHGFDPDWIVNRTGIHERRFAPPHLATSDFCAQAATRCLKAAGCEPGDVDLLVLGTMTPDMAFPSTACLVQDRLKLNCPAFDLQAACAGFAYALITAAQFVAAGTQQAGSCCRRRLQQPGNQPERREELSVVRRRSRGRASCPPVPKTRGCSLISLVPMARAAIFSIAQHAEAVCRLRWKLSNAACII